MQTLTEQQTARLVQIANRSTRYEASVCRTDGNTALLAYLRRHSTAGLLAAVTRNAEAVCIFLGDPKAQLCGVNRREMQVSFGELGHAGFTGRTERTAIMEGELARI